jgi:hypothetical protein
MFWLLGAFLMLLFATGGASRIDVQSLVILRPLSVIVCVIALATVQREHLMPRKWLLASSAALFAIARGPASARHMAVLGRPAGLG